MDITEQLTHESRIALAAAAEITRLRAEVEALKAENARLHTANERMRAALERFRCRDWAPDWVRDIANRALEGGE